MILYPLPADEPGSFRIECIAPSGNQIELYEGAIWSCMGPDGQIAGKLTRSQHNNISLVVKITYGETTILLGGDLEKEGWSQAIGEYGRDQLNASAVKVSHHGSENGYCDNLWEHFSSRGKPVAVITPSRLHRLPNPDALQHINQYACAIYATCQIWSDSSEAPIPRPTPPPPINSRLAIRRAFLAVPGVDDETQSGRCTLTFDDQGKCQIELDNHAQRLRIE